MTVDMSMQYKSKKLIRYIYVSLLKYTPGLKIKLYKAREKLNNVRKKIINLLLATKYFPFKNFLLKLNGLYNVETSHFNESNTLKKSYIVAEGGTCTIVAPFFYENEEQEKIINVKTAAICAKLFEDVCVSPYNSTVASKKEIMFSDAMVKSMHRVKTKEYPLYKQSGKLFYRYKPNMKIESGIHISGAGAENWYHFVIECLPRIYLTQYLPAEFNSYPILLPQECEKYESFFEALKLVSDKKKYREIIYFNFYDVVKVQNLLSIDEVSYGPFNLVKGEWPRITDYYQNDQLMRQFIAYFRESLLKDWAPEIKNKRIFLARPGIRREYNQTELIRIAEKYGFEVVFPEQLTLLEQAKLFAQSSMIVGPSGAAWVGMIFRKNPMIGLSWLPSVYKEFCSYSTLSNLLEHKLTFINAVPKSEIQTTAQAYRSSYKVNEDEFEAAIKKLVENKSF